jgi:hypothetical protein
MEFCNFMRFKRRNGTYTTWAAQNFFPGESKTFQSVGYQFVPIAVATNASTRGGDRSEAAISTVANELSLNVFREATKEDWLLEVKTVKVNRSNFELDALLSSEIWSCSQVQYDTSLEGVVLQLASPLDSVLTIGGRVLSQSLVGSLPTTGVLTLR